MKNYIKLVNFEFNRVVRLFAVLLGITLIVQLIGAIVVSKVYLNDVNQKVNEEMLPVQEFLNQYGPMTFLNFAWSTWFIGPIAICIAGIGFYIFFTWYRDWFGKNTFIYRLLMLPTTRLNIFFAKLTNILLLTLGMVAFQILLFPIETMIIKAIVPAEFILDMSMEETLLNVPELHLIIPVSWIDFLLTYTAGVTFVSILFTAILLERSFKWKGIIAGILFGICSAFLFLLPLLLQFFVLDNFFYPNELLLIELAVGLVILATSIWMSGFLLKKKITV